MKRCNTSGAVALLNTCKNENGRINQVDFIKAAEAGDIASINAKVTTVSTSSMEILAQDFACGVKNRKQILISDAFSVL